MNDQAVTTFKPQLTGGGAVVALVPQTLDEAYRLADAMSRSGLTPYNIKTPEAVMVCIMAGAELGFPPFQSLQSFAVIQGRPSIYGDAVPALLWSKGFDIDETFEGEDPAYPDTMKAICTVTRPNGKKVTRTFTVAEAKTAKLWGKKGKDGQDTPWITNPKRMIQMRARGFAARDGASDVMRGLPLYEEAMDFQPIREVETPAGTGMVERLSARPAEVDAPGFNVRSIAAETGQSMDAVLDGDNVPTGEDAPAEPAKRKRRTKAEMEAARAAEAAGASADEFAEVQSADETGGGEPEGTVLTERPTETGSAQAAEPEPDSSDSATDASIDSAEATSSQDDTPRESGAGEPEAADEGDAGEASQTTSDASPDLDDVPDVEGDEAVYIDTVGAATTFQAVKDAVVAFRRTDIYRGAGDGDKVVWQITAWDRLQALRAEGVETPSPHLNPWTYSLWLVWAKTNAKDQIAKVFAALQKTPAYIALNEAQQNGLIDGTKAALG